MFMIQSLTTPQKGYKFLNASLTLGKLIYSKYYNHAPIQKNNVYIQLFLNTFSIHHLYLLDILSKLSVFHDYKFQYMDPIHPIEYCKAECCKEIEPQLVLDIVFPFPVEIAKWW